jgi:tetratricopeptide (TPR) repeat protein
MKLATEADKVYDFAGYLHALGKYDEALVEYLRFLRLFPESELASEARVRVMNLYYDSQHYQDAIVWTEQNLSTQGFQDEALGGVYFWLGASYLKIGNAEKARECINQSISLQQSKFAEQGVLLKGYAYAQEGNWQEAADAFQEYQHNFQDLERGGALVSVCDDALRHHKKSPALAGVLGAIPGLGYIYAGHPGAALSALLIDSLLLASSYMAFDDGNAPLGALLGVVGVGWYTGSIYGSASAAERSNERDQRERLLQLKLGFRF